MPVCLNVLKSQCSKSSCVVDGKKALMTTAPTATKRSSKELLKEMMYEEDSDSEDEDNDSDFDEDFDEQDSDYDNENDADNEINVGDFVKITQDPYIGYYAVILQKSYGDEWEMQYCEKKYGKWVLKDNDLDSREP